MNIGNLGPWKQQDPRTQHLIGLVTDMYRDAYNTLRCTIVWACDRGEEEWIPRWSLEVYND